MMGSDSTWVGRKPMRRLGGMSDALSIAAELGFSLPTLPSQEEIQNLSTTTGENGDDLIRVLKELTAVQRKIADLQVELQGRKKIETLRRITTILKDVIQNKDRIVARLQQPYSLDCIPVEAEYQEMLRPIPVALASSTRFFEAMSAMRESIATLHALRVGHSSSLSTTPNNGPSQITLGDSDCVTPPPWRTESSFDDLAVGSLRRQESEPQEGSEIEKSDSMSHRRLSWPPSVKNI
ncbi:unnamed protein product [Withania somnifera]